MSRKGLASDFMDKAKAFHKNVLTPKMCWLKGNGNFAIEFWVGLVNFVLGLVCFPLILFWMLFSIVYMAVALVVALCLCVLDLVTCGICSGNKINLSYTTESYGSIANKLTA